MITKSVDRREAVRTMVLVAVFCAVSYVCQFIFRIHVLFLTFDAKDAVMTVAAMLFGPGWGLLMSLILATLEGISLSATGIIGFIMNFISSASFVCVSSWIYRRRRTMTGALFGLTTGVLSMTVVMLLCNLLLTPIYMNTTVAEVITYIPTLLLPFNFLKALLNAGLVLVLYKPISLALKRARLVKGEVGALRFEKKSVFVLVAGLLLTAMCIIIFIVLLNGSFAFGK